MLFFLRKTVGVLLAPSLWGYAAVVAGLALLFYAWLCRGRRAGEEAPAGRAALWGRRALVAGAVWLVILSLGVPFDGLGRWLEGQHAPLLDPLTVSVADSLTWVVVLGSGHRADPGLPVSAHLTEPGLYRAVEGVRLHRALAGSRLLFVGYGGPRRKSAAEVGAEVAAALGVEAGRVVAEGSPRTTGEEALAARALAGAGPVVLVTSAVHMPRAVRLFERAGVTVIPAPTGYGVLPRPSVRDWVVPAPDRLGYADAVAHELFGLVALWVE